MSRIDEIITEIDGKLAYACATGNNESKEELIEIKKLIGALKISKIESAPSLCATCNKGELGNCFCKPNVVINRKVIACSMHSGENRNEIQRLVTTG